MPQAIRKHLNKKMLGLFLLGIASGLPIVFTSYVFKGWLVQEYGKDYYMFKRVLTALSLLYVFRFVWAALFDKYRLSVIGLDKSKSWILLFQILIVILLVLISLTGMKAQVFQIPVLLILLTFLLAFCSASQHIAVDAYRVKMLTAPEVGLGSSLTLIGYRIGMLLFGPLVFFIAPRNWSTMCLILSLFMGLGMLGLYWVPSIDANTTMEIDNDEPNLSMLQQISVTLREFFQRDKSIYILLFIVLYKLPDVFAHPLVKPFLLSLNFSKQQIGVLGGFTAVAYLAGIFLGGILMIRMKLWHALFSFGILTAITKLFYCLLVVTGKNTSVALLGMMLGNLCSGMAIAAFLGFITTIAHKKYAALQYTLFAVCATVSTTYVGAAAKSIANSVSWQMYFLISALTIIPSLLLLRQFQNEI